MEDVDFEPPEMIWTKKIKNPCPWNYTKFYLNDSGTKRVCIKNDLTKFKVDVNEESKKIQLNPEKMKKLFHFSNIKIEPERVYFEAAMIYTLPQTRNKYLICSNFMNDEFGLFTKLIYGNNNQFMFIEGMFDDNKSLESMDSYILKRTGRLYKSTRDLSNLTYKELLQLQGDCSLIEYHGDDYELIYEGQIINEKFDTRGSELQGTEFLYKEPQDLYRGEWKEGLRHGNGTMWYENGYIYEGDWKDGLRHGNGKYRLLKKYVYEGKWKDDKKDGKGFEINGDVYYEGEWKEGLRHGNGFEIMNNEIYKVKFEMDIEKSKNFVYEGSKENFVKYLLSKQAQSSYEVPNRFMSLLRLKMPEMGFRKHRKNKSRKNKSRKNKSRKNKSRKSKSRKSK